MADSLQMHESHVKKLREEELQCKEREQVIAFVKKASQEL
jgi:hypothetical protein